MKKDPKRALVSRLRKIHSDLKALQPSIETDVPALAGLLDACHIANRTRVVLTSKPKDRNDKWLETTIVEAMECLVDLCDLWRLEGYEKLLFPDLAWGIKVEATTATTIILGVEVKHLTTNLQRVMTLDTEGVVLCGIFALSLPEAVNKALLFSKRMYTELEASPF